MAELVFEEGRVLKSGVVLGTNCVPGAWRSGDEPSGSAVVYPGRDDTGSVECGTGAGRRSFLELGAGEVNLPFMELAAGGDGDALILRKF